MNNTCTKKSLKIAALFVMIISSLAFFFGFGFFKTVAFAYDEADYYTLNFTVSENGTATIEYAGEGEYPDIEQTVFKAEDGNYRIHKTVADDTDNECLLRVVYEANAHYSLDTIMVDSTALASGENTFTYTSSVVGVNVSFKAEEYAVEIKTQFTADGETYESDNTLLENNMGVGLDQIKVSAYGTLFDDTLNVVANDRDADHLEFDGFYLVGETEKNITNGRSIETLTIDDEFISNYVKDGKITIYARYNYKKQLNISLDSTCENQGEFEVILVDKNSNVLEFVNENYYSIGTKYTIVPTAKDGYEFSHYLIDGERIYSEYYTDRIAYDNVDIKVFFTSKNYELSFYIVNSEFVDIDNQPLSISITYNSGDPYSSPVSKFVKVGDRIDEVRFFNFPNYENYRFVSWQVRNADGTASSISDALDIRVIKSLTIDQDFIDNFAKDGKISIYAVFVMQCHLSIQMDNVGKDYELVYGGNKINPEDLSEMTFDYGSVLTLSAPSVDNMQFGQFNGLIEADEYTGGTSVFIRMYGDRSISISYNFNKTKITLNPSSKVSNGSVALNKNEISVGDTLIISLNLKSGYRLTGFLINDKTAQQFVANVNRICGSETPVATCSENGIVTIYINQTVFDYFKDNEIKVVASSKMNSAYAILTAVYIVITLACVALLVWFFMLAGKNRLKVIELKEKQQKAIEKKQKEVEELYASENKEKEEKAQKPLKKTPAKSAKKNEEKKAEKPAEKKEVKEKPASKPKAKPAESKPKKTTKSNTKTNTKSQTKTKSNSNKGGK